MNKPKFMAVLLALSITLGSCAACDSNKDVTSTTNTIVETTTSETAVTTETTEATEETTEATTVETTVEEIDSPVYTPEGYDAAYKAYMDYIDTVEESGDSEYRYGFIECYNLNMSDAPYVLVISEAGSDSVSQYVSIDGNIFDDDTVLYDGPTMTYDGIKSLPVLINTSLYNENTVISNSIADGTYYGSMLAFSLDGTKAWGYFGKAITISEDKYNSLKEGDNLGDVINNDEFSDEYYTLSEDGRFGDDYHFAETTNGDGYILLAASDVVVTTSEFMAFVDISSDCAISDHFVWLEGTDKFQEESNSFIDTCYYNSLANDGVLSSYYINHNGWTGAYGLLEPVVIENGTITQMTLGWR